MGHFQGPLVRSPNSSHTVSHIRYLTYVINSTHTIRRQLNCINSGYQTSKTCRFSATKPILLGTETFRGQFSSFGNLYKRSILTDVIIKDTIMRFYFLAYLKCILSYEADLYGQVLSKRKVYIAVT